MFSNPIICPCLGLLKSDIEDVIRSKSLTTVSEISHSIGAGSICGACLSDLQEILDEVNRGGASSKI
ncbi:MAG: (2Fe-2S)-binding protein [Paludibacter sp.]|jgi:bacterioferritin-associated ferredoxin|nr:(2Fe-2S)-binding protein [Paludibacter sp.]